MSSRAFLWILEGASAGHVFPIHLRAVIGRAVNADVCIAERSMGRRHACVERVEGTWMLTDFRSTNGTLLRGNRIQKPTPLEDGDVFSMGGLVVRFSIVDPGLPLEVRRVGDWLIVDPADPIPVAVSSTSGARGTALRGFAASLTADHDAGLAPWLPTKLGHADGWCFLEDFAGVRLAELIAAAPAGNELAAEIEAPRRWVELRCDVRGWVVEHWVLTFDGRMIALPRLRDGFEDKLRMMHHAPTPRAVPPPPSPAPRDLVRGLLQGLVPERVAAHERLIEDIGILGVQGLLEHLGKGGDAPH